MIIKALEMTLLVVLGILTFFSAVFTFMVWVESVRFYIKIIISLVWILCLFLMILLAMYLNI